MMNPRLFRPDYRMVNFPDKPVVFYLAALNLQGVKYPTRKVQSFKTARKARKYAMRVMARWCRLYDAAVLALSMPEPTANINPSQAEA